MSNTVFLGFDFGFKRIGVAVGQSITLSARPLTTLAASQGNPDWQAIQQLITQWQPSALIVGLPKTIDNKKQYTTKPAKQFAQQLRDRFDRPVHLVDERLTTKEARANVFASGGYKKLKKSEIDAHAAAIILEQWLMSQ